MYKIKAYNKKCYNKKSEIEVCYKDRKRIDTRVKEILASNPNMKVIVTVLNKWTWPHHRQHWSFLYYQESDMPEPCYNEKVKIRA